MRRILVAGASVAAMLLPVPQGARGASSSGLSVLMVTPHEGHSGSLVDLSGYGLPAHRRLGVIMACPSFTDADAYDYQNIESIPGPMTDGRGQFAGFLFHAVKLHHVPQSGCQIYLSDPNDMVPLANDIIPTYYILAPGKRPAAACDRALCVSVQAHPVRVRTGLRERIAVKTWPGATVSVRVSYPWGKQTAVKRRADPWGNVSLSQQIQRQVTSDTPVKVTASVKLGPQHGASSVRFTITR
jgi:hypothetical protein